MTLTIVGDVDQMLYRFQGANPDVLMTEIENEISNIQSVKLETNYRSYDEIIEASQKLIAYNYSDKGGLYPQEAMKITNGVKGPGGLVAFDEYGTATDESQGVASKIRELIDYEDYAPGSFFVGARTRAQLGYLEGELTRNRIPFINIASNGSFWQSKHINILLSYLRLSQDTNDTEAFKACYNISSNYNTHSWNDKRGRFKIGDYKPTRFLGHQFLQSVKSNFNNIKDTGKFAKRTEDLQDFMYNLLDIANQSPATIIRYIIEECLETYLNATSDKNDDELGNARLEDLATVEEIASTFDNTADFLSYVNQLIQAADDAKNENWDNYVIISTIHGLKGLERQIVFGLGLSEGIHHKTELPVGLLPHTFSMVNPPQFGVLPTGTMSPIEDERCITFVLISRAIERCYLSSISEYRNNQMWPSRFIRELGLVE